jgi:hypothetical protein
MLAAQARRTGHSSDHQLVREPLRHVKIRQRRFRNEQAQNEDEHHDGRRSDAHGCSRLFLEWPLIARPNLHKQFSGQDEITRRP